MFGTVVNVKHRVFSISILCIAGGLAACLGSPLSADDAPESGDRYYPVQGTWTPSRSGTEHVSLFVYRDTDHSGEYGIDDFPIANIAVKLYRPDGSHVIRRSNHSGFANFTTSLVHSGADISEVGRYEFEVIVPPNWRMTSGNGIQSARFREHPETRLGLIAGSMPRPVGLAQKLEIAGRVARRNNDGDLVAVADAWITVASPSGKKETIKTGDSGQFSIGATRGTWEIQVIDPETKYKVRRTVEVTGVPVRLSTIITDDEDIGKGSSEEIMNFDSLTQAKLIRMPDRHSDLEWSNLAVTRNDTYLGIGYLNNTVSGRYVGYNSSGYPAAMEHKDGFDFIGGYFGASWRQAEGEWLEVRAWRDDELVSEESFRLSAYGPFWFDADYRDITRIKFSTRHYWQFVMDDIRYRLRQ